jgi:hypothetical protein
MAWIVLLLIVTGKAFAVSQFDTFRRTRDLKLTGSAGIAEGRILRLTKARTNQSGAAWLIEKQPVAGGFDTTFEFQLTAQGGLGPGADGFAFVLQNAGPSALGGRGSVGGFAVADPNYHHDPGIPWSIAVFFDTFQNTAEGDPSGNYIALRTSGRPGEMKWPAERLAFTPNLHVVLKDRQAHTARVLYQPPSLSVYLDGAAEPVLEARVDLSIVLDALGRAWVGFTASTGGGYENHDILNWKFSGADVDSSMSVVSSEITFLMAECLPDRNLCTPRKPVVERTGTGYHIILPANSEWGVSIPNAAGKAVAISNAHGIACWDAKARAADGCSGPAGTGSLAAEGRFLSPGAPPGALVMKQGDGMTWFSVNGRGGTFAENEGFFEFDVEIQ